MSNKRGLLFDAVQFGLTFAVLPVAQEDMPRELCDAITRRRIAAITGECPCGTIRDHRAQVLLANPAEPPSGARTTVQPRRRCSIGCRTRGRHPLHEHVMTEPSHTPTLDNPPAFTRRSRTLECPACFHLFQVYECGPTRFPESKAYNTLASTRAKTRALNRIRLA